MSNYKRQKSVGGTFFFTVVTYKRKPVLENPVCIKRLRASIKETRRTYPFHIDAWVLLPEHMHCIWTLPDRDGNYSRLWGLIKQGFTKRARALLPDATNSLSRIKHREACVWQRRFWEHEIRNEEDFNNHVDYIHYNPVKHGHVQRVQDWPFSTFHRYVKQGIYSVDWAGDGLAEFTQEYGE